MWKATPKVVFSRTLAGVGPEYRLVRDDAASEVARLKEETTGELAVGGAGLAASSLRTGLIDELRPFVHPVVLGGGTPYLPPLERPLELRLVETRTFGMGVVYLRYEIG
jgi:dihydrofolate reductase